MVTTIQHELKKLEAAQNIRILYAVESGSRAWGFASTNSDWDVRFIYVHTPDWYLRIDDRKDCIEQMLPDDLDLSGWELQKALRLFRKSNPPLLEWLQSPLVYQQDDRFLATMQSATNRYFNPKSCLYHYFHMARGNWEAYFKTDEVRLKKYLYVLRPLLACMWIKRTGTMAPMEFDILLQNEIHDIPLRQAVDALLVRKKSGEELSTGSRITLLDSFLEKQLHHFDTLLTSYPATELPNWAELNHIFKTTLLQSWKKEEYAPIS
jgi:uncharacterized protein